MSLLGFRQSSIPLRLRWTTFPSALRHTSALYSNDDLWEACVARSHSNLLLDLDIFNINLITDIRYRPVQILFLVPTILWCFEFNPIEMQ